MLLNLLWIVCGGLWMAVGWVIAAVVMAITIIGLPWTRAAFNIAAYTLLPFGQKVVSRAAYGHNDMGTGPLGVLGNVLWLILAGWWLALGHLITAIMLAITIVGIPFAWAHVKLAGLALWPIGRRSWVRRTQDWRLGFPASNFASSRRSRFRSSSCIFWVCKNWLKSSRDRVVSWPPPLKLGNECLLPLDCGLAVGYVLLR